MLDSQLIKLIESDFAQLDMDKIMAWFTHDVIVKYNHMSPIIGKDALKEFLQRKYESLIHYSIDKRLIHSEGNEAFVEVNTRYTDKHNRYRYETRIFEHLIFKGRQISRWDYVGNTQQI